MNDILALIDNAIRDTDTSNDAMRWTPEPPSPASRYEEIHAARRMFSVAHDTEYRESVCAWLRANGVDVRTVPIDARGWIRDGWIHVETWPANPSTWPPPRLPVAVPMTVEPSATVSRWLVDDDRHNDTHAGETAADRIARICREEADRG